MSTDDYEEIDYKICGELGKQEVIDIHNFFRGEKQGHGRFCANSESRGGHTSKDSIAGSMQGTRKYS